MQRKRATRLGCSFLLLAVTKNEKSTLPLASAKYSIVTNKISALKAEMRRTAKLLHDRRKLLDQLINMTDSTDITTSAHETLYASAALMSKEVASQLP